MLSWRRGKDSNIFTGNDQNGIELMVKMVWTKSTHVRQGAEMQRPKEDSGKYYGYNRGGHDDLW